MSYVNVCICYVCEFKPGPNVYIYIVDTLQLEMTSCEAEFALGGEQ